MVARASFLIKTAMTGLACLNELLLFSNGWIISPPRPAKHFLKAPFIHPLITAITYAVAEPLYTYVLLWLSAPPSMAVMSLSQAHLMSSHLLKSVASSGIPASGSTAGSSSQAVQLEKAVSTKSSDIESDIDVDDSPGEQSVLANAALLMSVQTAALTNAAALLFTQSLYVSHSWSTYRSLVFTIDFLALIFYLGIKLSDFSIGKITGRAIVFGQFGLGHARTQFACLAVLLVVRGLIRKAIGLDIFMFGSMDAEKADELFGPQRYESVAARTGALPQWLGPLLSLISFGMAVLGLWLIRR